MVVRPLGVRVLGCLEQLNWKASFRRLWELGERWTRQRQEIDVDALSLGHVWGDDEVDREWLFYCKLCECLHHPRYRNH